MKLDVRKEIAEITKYPAVIAGLVVLGILMCMVPVFWILLPFVIVFLVILYKIGEKNNARALKIARKHTGGVACTLEILEDMELASSLVLNDWGIIYLPAGEEAIELAWSQIDSVDEIGLAMLEIKAGQKKLKIDLSQRRYTLITEALDSMLKGKCHFLIDPVTGKSHQLEYLMKQPIEWSKIKLRVDNDGIKYNGNAMRWDEIESIVEEEVHHRSSMPTLNLSISNGRQKFNLQSDVVSDETGLPGSSAYEHVKVVAKEKLGRKASFIVAAALPAKRGLDEFMRMQDAYKAAYAIVLESGKYHVIEPRFSEMLRIVDKFDLANQICVQQFFHDYALLLERMGRDNEAQLLKRRINTHIE
ncbi:MAG: hypothetical protein SFY67_03920 [Candidatus Melainabacteria bacterium]|nr:hypothetical protein [Candidatus Melainabacteria bacterium]